jgi:hypothetical protein
MLNSASLVSGKVGLFPNNWTSSQCVVRVEFGGIFKTLHWYFSLRSEKSTKPANFAFAAGLFISLHATPAIYVSKLMHVPFYACTRNLAFSTFTLHVASILGLEADRKHMTDLGKRTSDIDALVEP